MRNNFAKPHPAVNERVLLLVLAIVQFTTVLDFLIMMPLGPQYMRVFAIGAGKFGVMVSSYAISAGAAGIVASVFLDRFDRKHALCFLYFGFGLGTLFCALAPGFAALTAARVVAGAFGGVTGALIMAVIGDIVPEERRGAAMGMVMSSFSLASIFGVPFGLFLANRFGWHAPFYLLALLSVPVLLGIWFVMPSLREHMARPGAGGSLSQFRGVLGEPNHWRAFAFVGFLTCAGFSVFPYISPYMVKNVGLTEAQLPWIYLAGGLCTIISMNIIGRLADRFGKLRLFTWMSVASIGAILLITNLPRVSVVAAIAASTLCMICMSGRMVPAMALMTSSVRRQYRGGFMSLSSSVQSFASGLGALVSGAILGQTATGKLTHYGIVGILSGALAAVAIFLARRIRREDEFDEIRIEPEQRELSPALFKGD